MGVTLITLTGGEPFLREADDRLITRAAAEFPNMGFLVYTNATLIDEEVAERLGRGGQRLPRDFRRGVRAGDRRAARKRLHDARHPRPQRAGKARGHVRLLGDGHSQERRSAQRR